MRMKMGTNIGDILYYTRARELLDVMKFAPGWDTYTSSNISTNEHSQLPLDANGHPTSISFGTTQRVGFGLFIDTQNPSVYYKPGRYYVVYNGTATFAYLNDAVRNAGASSAGRDAFDVATPSNNGFRVFITSMGAEPNHCQIQYICHEDDEAAILAGQYWHPDFVETLQECRVIRFLNTIRANDVHPGGWADRPKLTQPFWGTSPETSTYVYSGGVRIPGGAPIEVMIDLCNRTLSDFWWQQPCLDDPAEADEYEFESATLIKQLLDPRLMVYRESWNEEWNFQTAGLTGLGATEFPTGNSFQRGFNYHILRTVMAGQIWRGVWGARGTPDGDRLRVVMGGQAANASRTGAQLRYKCDGSYGSNNIPAAEEYFTGQAGDYVDAQAIAPYYWESGGFPEAWVNEVDGGLTKVFTELTDGGLIPTASMGTTSGTSTAYTVTTGLSLTARPADQSIIAITLHTATGANPTLAADGGTAYPIKTIRGGAAYSSSAATRVFCFDRTTDEWVWVSTGLGYSGAAGTGEIARSVGHVALTRTAIDAADNGANIEIVVYECGGHLVDYGNDQPTTVGLTMTAFQTDPRLYQASLDYFQGFNDAGVTVACYYDLINRWSSQYGYWGSLNSIDNARSATDTPKWQALNDFALAQRTHTISFGAAP